MRQLIAALMILTLGVGPTWAGESSEETGASASGPLAGFPGSLAVASPKEGFQLAIKLARLGVKATQPDLEVLKRLRPVYAEDPDSLIAASQVIAIHYQTIAAANNYWRSED